MNMSMSILKTNKIIKEFDEFLDDKIHCYMLYLFILTTLIGVRVGQISPTWSESPNIETDEQVLIDNNQ